MGDVTDFFVNRGSSESEPAHSGSHLSNVYSGHQVRVEPQARRIIVPRGTDTTEPSMDLELVRDGQIIRAIKIVCSCGQHMKLNCHYAP